MSAIERWNSSVKAHHAQSLRAQGGREPEDFWQPFAANFQLDPHRTDDPVVNRLLREVTRRTTVLDVGGGGGRLALPLALRCRHATVVEPSASMLEVLRQGAREAGIQNLTIVQGSWEDVDVEPSEVVLCAHVLYGVDDIEPFVRRLEAHATDRVLILMFMDAPQSHLSPVWRRVHHEERLLLPALGELLPVLWEMGLYPDLEMVHAVGAPAYDTREKARDELRRRLYVSPGTEEDRRLEQAMEELLEETPDGFAVHGAAPRRLGLLTWRRGG